MDSSAVPNFVSSKVVNALALAPEGFIRVILVENGEKEIVQGRIMDVLVTIGDLVIKMDFVVMEKLPFHVVI